MLNITKIINNVTTLLVHHLYKCFQHSTFCPELPTLRVINLKVMELNFERYYKIAFCIAISIRYFEWNCANSMRRYQKFAKNSEFVWEHEDQFYLILTHCYTLQLMHLPISLVKHYYAKHNYNSNSNLPIYSL